VDDDTASEIGSLYSEDRLEIFGSEDTPKIIEANTEEEKPAEPKE
jgi:hypothetical protein